MIALIRELLLAQPFEPFSILSSNGKRYRVATADHAAIGPRDGQAVVWFDNGGSVMLSGLHVVGVEKEAAESAPAA